MFAGKRRTTVTDKKTFKNEVRARMAKTGESYTVAREMLLRGAAAQPEHTPQKSWTLGLSAHDPEHITLSFKEDERIDFTADLSLREAGDLLMQLGELRSVDRAVLELQHNQQKYTVELPQREIEFLWAHLARALTAQVGLVAHKQGPDRVRALFGSVHGPVEGVGGLASVHGPTPQNGGFGSVHSKK